jgi:pimeloyl-ACP methyl ester carboxylesterase
LTRWLKRLLVVSVTGVLLFLFGFLPYLLAGAFTVRTFQMKDVENQGLTPASFQLSFEDVSFNARDGVPLAGWWVPARNAKGTVVLVHGLNRSRVEMVRKLPFLHQAGWNALLFDLRRHGASGGTVRSLGWGERLDVLGAVDDAGKRAPLPVVAWGISFGGAAVVLAAAEEPRISGIVCDSSYRDLRDTAHHHLELFRQMASRPSSSTEKPPLMIQILRAALPWVPTWPTADVAVFWMGHRAGFNPDDLDIRKAATKLGSRPALFVGGSGDERMPADLAQELRSAAGPSAKLLIVASQGHGHAYRDGTEAYEKAVLKLLQEVVRE